MFPLLISPLSSSSFFLYSSSSSSSGSFQQLLLCMCVHVHSGKFLKKNRIISCVLFLFRPSSPFPFPPHTYILQFFFVFLSSNPVTPAVCPLGPALYICLPSTALLVLLIQVCFGRKERRRKKKKRECARPRGSRRVYPISWPGKSLLRVARRR